MEPDKFLDPNLTPQDRLLLENLLRDANHPENSIQSLSPSLENDGISSSNKDKIPNDSYTSQDKKTTDSNSHEDAANIHYLESLNDPKNPQFDPTVFVTWDTPNVESSVPPVISKYLLRPYIRFARRLVRVETDVVMLTHLILYFTTSVPSALYLYYNFSWTHGILHWLMQSYYVGTFTLMMHQHIHMGGILSRSLSWFDLVFPYILYPLMGHTWNSYYYHHVKHHHVEANGPGDLSSTMFYQRDSIVDLARYVGRFLFFVWFELPRYFLRRGHYRSAFRATFWELSNYTLMIGLYKWVNPRATAFVLFLPFVQLRLGLMVGNWGQHAFVDEVDPDSDFRSSTTLVDVPSNRFCYNDGYHTSHHLNPRRHWRDHPVAFLKQKHSYASEDALVFRNIDYIMITVKLMQKDYMHLAKCLVPMGKQIPLSLEERADMLKRKTKKFTKEEAEEKFRGK